MKALLVNCTLKPSPAESNTEALAGVVAAAAPLATARALASSPIPAPLSE